MQKGRRCRLSALFFLICRNRMKTNATVRRHTLKAESGLRGLGLKHLDDGCCPLKGGCSDRLPIPSDRFFKNLQSNFGVIESLSAEGCRKHNAPAGWNLSRTSYQRLTRKFPLIEGLFTVRPFFTSPGQMQN